MGFSGTFDGRGYSIVGYTFQRGGLFGELDKNAVIKNLTISGATVTQNGGAVLAQNIDVATVTNCTFEAYSSMVGTSASCQYIFCYIGKNVSFSDITVNVNWQTEHVQESILAHAIQSGSEFKNVKVNQSGNMTVLLKSSSSIATDGITFSTVTAS